MRHEGSANLPLIIVNPKSAGGSTQFRWSQIASDLRSHFGPYTAAFTKAPGDGIALARRFAESGRKLIIACGGDGTINEVVNGIKQSQRDVELGIIPAGTGGDFRRTLGISSVPREAAMQLRNGTTREIDLGRVEFIGRDGAKSERYFINVASFGLSASINDRVKQKGEMQWIPGESVRGKTKFALSTLQEVMGPEPKLVRVSIDGAEAASLATLNFCVCNGRFFGGGMKIAPDAALNDGKLDLVNIGDLNTAKILLNGYKLYSGSHLELPEVRATKVSRIEVEPANPREDLELEIDGELPGKLPAVFEVVERGIRVRVPSD